MVVVSILLLNLRFSARMRDLARARDTIQTGTYVYLLGRISGGHLDPDAQAPTGIYAENLELFNAPTDGKGTTAQS